MGSLDASRTELSIRKKTPGILDYPFYSPEAESHRLNKRVYPACLGIGSPSCLALGENVWAAGGVE